MIERQAVAAGSTGAGEGNLLLSDKEAGPELEMALRSAQLWAELGEVLGGDSFELEMKGGVVVATSEEALARLRTLGMRQGQLGVITEPLDADQLCEAEPHLAPDLPGGLFYPGDAQVQPALATAQMLRAAVSKGALLQLGSTVTGLRLEGNRVTAVVTDEGVTAADHVVNAAGTWGGELSGRFGAPIPVMPRRGFVLVSEPLPPVIRHKVYSADYVASVASDSESLEMSCVVEGTRSGPVLIGASRERVGFDRTIAVPVVRHLAARAVALFPMLAAVSLMRVYAGFRPFCPDHLPVVGPDPRVAGLLHACGHEGAGIGLAPATGELVAELITGRSTTLDARPFSPGRLLEGAP